MRPAPGRTPPAADPPRMLPAGLASPRLALAATGRDAMAEEGAAMAPGRAMLLTTLGVEEDTADWAASRRRTCRWRGYRVRGVVGRVLVGCARWRWCCLVGPGVVHRHMHGLEWQGDAGRRIHSSHGVVGAAGSSAALPLMATSPPPLCPSFQKGQPMPYPSPTSSTDPAHPRALCFTAPGPCAQCPHALPAPSLTCARCTGVCGERTPWGYTRESWKAWV